jgi:hypothetical protein
MTHDQETRLLTLSHNCAQLQVELEADRQHVPSGDPRRALIRAVCGRLRNAQFELTKAIERMKK